MGAPSPRQSLERHSLQRDNLDTSSEQIEPGQIEKQLEAEQQPVVPIYSSFTKWQKRLIVLAAAMTAFFSPLSAQIYFPALTAIAKDLNVTDSQVNLTVTTYMIFQGITPMFIGSLADSGGRRPAYAVCFAIYIAANIGLALAPGYGALLGLRCLQSAGSSSTVALCVAVVADVVTSAERGQYIGFTTVPVVLAPALGPVIGGLLSEYLGWRSIFWFLAILAGITVALVVVFFPETCRHIVGDGSITPPAMYRSLWQILKRRRKTANARNNPGGPAEAPRVKSQYKFKAPNVLEPIMMLFQKETGLLLAFGSIVFAGFYCIATAMPTQFEESYGFNTVEVGLMYLPLAVGSIIAALAVGPLINYNFKRHCEKLGIPFDRSRQQDLSDFPVERARLEVGFPLLGLTAVSLIAWGWSLDAEAHPAVPGVLSAIVGVGMIGLNNTTNALLVDIHPGKAGTATAANNLARCLVGAGATAAIVPMINAMGVGWAFTLIGGLLFLCCPALVALMVWGPKWRRELKAKVEKKRQAKSSLLFLQTLSATVVTIIILLATVVVYRLVFHPLASIPGPKWAAVSSVWHAYHARNGRMAYLGRTLHGQYGPVVRVGPNEVWFNTRQAFQAIYSTGSGFEKSDFYLATALSKPSLTWKMDPHFPDSLDLLSERDTQRYRLQRRLIGPVYQTSNLLQYEAAIDSVLEHAIAKIKSLKGAEVELNEWMHIIAVECLSAVVLSWSPGMLRNGTDWGSGPHAYHSWRRKTVFGLLPAMAKLESWHKTAGRLFSTAWRVNFRTPKHFRPFFPEVGKKISRRVNAATRAVPPKDTRKDLIADLIRLHKSKPSFTDTYLRRMAMTNFGAGHETMASTLTSIIAMVGSREDVRARVANEILETNAPSEYATAIRLPILQALVKESKRLYPVVSMSLPRKVPQSGLRLHDAFFPPGTTVGCNPVALHRNADVFGADSSDFRIDRWMNADQETLRNMERFSLSWGGGSRTCPGRHLAELVVFKVVPALVREFEIEASIPPEDEIPSYFLSMLTGVKVRFVERRAA
ncbi:hypothetical protein AK830_g8516 [Neonectria ditissima]|uniref:Major facilitator superfamily (MFS) profile domain-containing protein n=1 Tax=Neonectria ditissima TaxID=78410 RepID=A0A0P7B7W5_9HYPO|nr:hypothetical protein AK830_g8516 [Neonectria ditissima]